MRSRNRLHKNKLDDFKKWLLVHGWINCTPVGEYEVLRMKKPGARALLVFRRNELKEHYTTYGVSEDQLSIWLKERQKI